MTSASLFLQVAALLNVAPHTTLPGNGGAPVLLCGPADMEGHVGEDGRRYVLDCARLFPPARPDKACLPYCLPSHTLSLARHFVHCE